MDDVVDVSTLESEKEQLKNQLRQVVGAKRKLTEQLDKLDVGDKHYDRKYQDMQDRMDNLYDKISEIEGALSGIEEQIKHTYERHFSAKDLYQILENFDKLYVNMSDLEKKEFFQNFIEYIELLPEKNSDGRILKHIRLKFPVYYNGEEKEDIRLLNGETVETVCCIRRDVK